MKTKNKFALTLVAAAVSLGAHTTAQAADYYLCAGQTMQTMPDGVVVPMWGYALDDDNDLSNGCGSPVQVPGPRLDVPVGDSVLNIHLRNDLAEATSIMIPGQPSTFAPVEFTDAQGRSRVRAFVQETAAGATGLYTWNGVRPGTYAYQSGSHPAVQIQMGLYGPMVHDSAAGEAYPGRSYANELLLVYSEVDPVLHNAIADGSYGTAPAPTSTVGYKAQYFLINGQDNPVAALPGGVAGQSTLIRVINMGLESHMPMIHNADFSVIAEDGHPYAYPRQQYSVMVAAGQSRDLLFAPAVAGSYAMLDRMLNLTNRRPPVATAALAASGTGDTTSSPGTLISLLDVDADSDHDGIGDRQDNCTLVPNPSQRDSDGDGFGNACDADLNNDGIVNTGDLFALRAAFFQQALVFDFNDDGAVNTADLFRLRDLFLAPPGPAGQLP